MEDYHAAFIILWYIYHCHSLAFDSAGFAVDPCDIRILDCHNARVHVAHYLNIYLLQRYYSPSREREREISAWALLLSTSSVYLFDDR